VRAYLGPVLTETLADRLEPGPVPTGLPSATVQLDWGPAEIALRRRHGTR